MEQVSSNNVVSIKKLFADNFKKELSEGVIIERSDLFEFFKIPEFVELVHALATEIRQGYFSENNNTVLQPSPTGRIFCPGQHGTSFHTDHMYGHGEKSKTIWVPLHGEEKDNTFSFLKKDREGLFSETDLGLNYSVEMENAILNNAENVDVADDEYVIFSSLEIHGSPKNISNKVRYSFDFRMADLDYETSNKGLHNYYKFENGSWFDTVSHYRDKNYLKYICGSKNFSTRAQHIIINATAEEYGLNVVGQDAELERFGFPMLEKYLNGLADEKAFDSLIVASLRIFDMDALNLIKNSNTEVFVANEERYY